MNNIESYYCEWCDKYTRHIRMSNEECMSNCDIPWAGRILGAFADYTGVGKMAEFVLNNYSYKCCACGRQTCRNSQGIVVTEK